MAIFVAVACGASLGAGAGVWKIRQHPWIGGIGTPLFNGSGQVEVAEEEFDFGKMDAHENHGEGKHEFTFTNRDGDKTLTLSRGSTSCSCTVSEIPKGELAPGESSQVLVSWKSKGRVGPFKQHVTIITSDPLRTEVTLTIKGEYTRSVYVDPDELTFGQIPGNKPVAREARILCNLPSIKIAIPGQQMSDPTLAEFFQVDRVPLGADELRKHVGAVSGVLVRVTAKPGLPLGRFQQRITLNTNVPSVPEIDLPLFGTVGEVSLVGPGWNSETGVLDIGAVDGRSVTQRRLIVLGRGPDAKAMKFKVVSVEPDFLNVKLGKTTGSETATLSQTELLIEIPESEALGKKVPVNYLGTEKGKLGEILLETHNPELHSVRIRVRFAVGGVNPAKGGK